MIDQGLPAALLDSEAFQRMTEAQVVAFEGRLVDISEMIDSINDWCNGSDPEGLADFIDRLEMDLAENQGLPGQDSLSSYLIHTTWTYATTVPEMRQALSPAVLPYLDEALPSINATEAEIRYWLKWMAHGLHLALERFYAAVSFTALIAHYLAIDVLLANMLGGVYKLRLNPVMVEVQ